MKSIFCYRRFFILLTAFFIFFQTNGIPAFSSSKQSLNMKSDLQASYKNPVKYAAFGSCDTVYDMTGDTTSFTLDPSTIYVVADNAPARTKIAACVNVKKSGYYRIWVQELNDKSQKNESFYLSVVYPNDSLITACDSNLGPYKVVPDTTAPDTVDSQHRYAGLFFFKKGINKVLLNHYSKIVNEYPEYWNGPTDSSSVFSKPNSVHFKKMTLIYSNGVFDAALSYSAKTDTVIRINGQPVQAVPKGGDYQYELKLSNVGTFTLRNTDLMATVPDSVEFLNIQPVPTDTMGDTLHWRFDTLSPGLEKIITIDARASNALVNTPHKIFSSAWVYARCDTLLGNNTDSTTVYAFDPCDFFTPEMPQIQTFPSSVNQGDSVSVRVRLPKGVVSWDVLVTYVNGRVDSSYADAFIASTGNAADRWLTLQPVFTDTRLLTGANQENIIFEVRSLDKCGHFNTAQDTVTVHRIIEKYDLKLNYTAQTDTMVSYNGQSVKAVLEGGTYSYKIDVTNTGPDTARGVKLWAIRPDSVEWRHFIPAPETVKSDTVRWLFDKMAPGQAVEVTFDAEVSRTLPVSPAKLFSKAQVQANADTNQTNNTDSTVVFAFNTCAFFTPEMPQIKVNPGFVDVGDSVDVRVRLPKGVVSWDVRVIYVNGQVDSSYADAFINRTGNVSDQWLDLQPAFTNTRLVTKAFQEVILFEVRSVDRCGNIKTARVQVFVRSGNDCFLDRNVFQAENSLPLGIKFKLSSNRKAQIDLYDISGYHIMKIVEGNFSAGWNTYRWDGTMHNGKKIGSGVYIITVKSGHLMCWKKVILVR
ncbi:hypothetical protein BMS3Abin05_01572 [bacterium BMS3Abin05]|nr:hypothetical protein BMS3Abin05_01572 [bacterium BMS3Abin05]